MVTSIVLNHLPLKHIKPTLDSLDFSDQIILLQDKNYPLKSSRLPARVKIYHRPLGTDFASQRNFALDKAKGDWVLFVDSDEVVPASLAQEIKRSINRGGFDAFLLPRQDIFYSQRLRYGETGQIKLLRLAKRSAGRFHRSVHENWHIQGRVGELTEPLLHYKKDLTTGFIDRLRLYSPIDAHSLDQESKPFSIFRLFLNPPAKFFLNYIVRRGYFDGLLGLFHAYLMSVQSFTVRVFQKEAQLA